MYANAIGAKSGDIESQGNLAYNEHRATLLIVDRGHDLASAFAHSYHYGAMLYEIPKADDQI